MADRFQVFPTTLDSPGEFADAVTPNDGADLAFTSRMIYVGSGGNLTVQMVGNTAATVTFTNLSDAQALPIRVQRVMATGTTASDIVAVY